jgi:hypothetical protein
MFQNFFISQLIVFFIFKLIIILFYKMDFLQKLDYSIFCHFHISRVNSSFLLYTDLLNRIVLKECKYII